MGFFIWGIFYVKYCEFQLVYTVCKYDQEYQTQGQMSAFQVRSVNSLRTG